MAQGFKNGPGVQNGLRGPEWPMRSRMTEGPRMCQRGKKAQKVKNGLGGPDANCPRGSSMAQNGPNDQEWFRIVQNCWAGQNYPELPKIARSALRTQNGP